MPGGMLQWGRAHVSAEIYRAAFGKSAEYLLLQWGRAHVSAEICSRAAGVARRGLLQWGRAHVSAEMCRRR